MNVQDVMKMFGLNARGAAKKLKAMQLADPSLLEPMESAESADSAESASTESEDAGTPDKDEKWLSVVAKLDTYAGRMTAAGYPHTSDLEQLLGKDITPEFRTKLWDKYIEYKSNNS